MATSLCPHCRSIKNTRVVLSRSKEKGPDGKMKEILTRSIHCESCGSFIHSQDQDISKKK